MNLKKQIERDAISQLATHEGAAPLALSSTLGPKMFVLMAVTSLIALLFVYLFMPTLWESIMAVDDALDRHESGIALVASRNPFRETGPPANMAKLILLRHKIQTSARKRRNSSRSRRSSRAMVPLTNSRPKPAWMRFSRPSANQYH